ncbi:hypothetical protein C3F00_015950 [Pseudomonas sp. MWU13-2860]|nr:hypothetical protein C3F00_015950 [Pseudomonas sp. MWU13-2860]
MVIFRVKILFVGISLWIEGFRPKKLRGQALLLQYCVVHKIGERRRTVGAGLAREEPLNNATSIAA